MADAVPISPTLGYYLGCPGWACPDCADVIYPAKAKRSTWLSWYARSFNAVEGNTTFYALPTRETVSKWASEAAEGFQFCLKFPREISHHARLVGCESLTTAFLDRLQLLKDANRLGPSFLQVAPTFSAKEFGALVSYLDAWPIELPLAVEVRHADYFDDGRNERNLNELLLSRGVDRCLFDSRCLFSAPASNETERDSQRRKPNSPHRITVTGSRPMLRFVGRDQIELADPWIAEWAPIVASWLDQGLKPYVFMHAPNDAFAPILARRFHAALRALHDQTPQLPVPAFGPQGDSSRQRMLF